MLLWLYTRHMAKRAQRAKTIDFKTGTVDQLAACEAKARELPLGRLVTQPLLVRAALGYLAAAPSSEFLKAVQAQLRVEFGNGPDAA